MKAAQIAKYGGKDEVKVNEIPKPAVSEGRVLVEAYAAGVNPYDWMIREGHVQQRVPIALPATLGGDFAGVVSEVGPGVANFKKGDEVYGHGIVLAGNSGAFAEYVLVKAGNIAKKPKMLDFISAAALPLVGISALDVLTNKMKLSKGQKVLIHGAGGGIGSIAVQIAKHLGAYVAATAGTADLEYVKGLGADLAIDYKARRFYEILKEYDAVYDTVGKETYEKSFLVLKKGGVLVSMTTPPNEALASKYGVRALYESSGPLIVTENLEKLAELADKGAVKVHIDKIFGLGQAGEAIDYQHSGHPRGKVVIKIRG